MNCVDILMDLFYSRPELPKGHGRIHLLKDEPLSKSSIAMTNRWQNTLASAPKRDKIVRCFKISGWTTVAEVAKKTKIDHHYVQRVAVKLLDADFIERRRIDYRSYEYRVKGAHDAS